MRIAAMNIKHVFLSSEIVIPIVQQTELETSHNSEAIWYLLPNSRESEAALLSQLKEMPIYIDSNVFLIRRDEFLGKNGSVPVYEAYRKGPDLPLVYQQVCFTDEYIFETCSSSY